MEFHRTDHCLIDGDRTVIFSPAQTCVMWALWSRRGKWVKCRDLLVGFDGRRIPSEDPTNLAQQHLFNIRKKLRRAKIDLVIECQHTSFWADLAYRIPKED